MWTDLVALMKVGVRRGKIITIRRRGRPRRAVVRRGRPRTYVYRRAGEPCRVCGTPIRTEVMEARNLFWCPTCQVSVRRSQRGTASGSRPSAFDGTITGWN